MNVRKHRKPRVIKTSLAVASGARVAAAQARYEAELDNEYFEAGMTPGEQAYWDAIEGAAQ
ncbi:MAG: hypothetical protein EBY28_23585 [Betaproteobacteria bacterium]|nr:hypothetical protein [Betaproteobacteria bacterium]